MWHLKHWIFSKCVIQAWSLIQYPLKHNLICYIWMFKWLHVKLAHRWQSFLHQDPCISEKMVKDTISLNSRDKLPPTWLHPLFRFTPSVITGRILGWEHSSIHVSLKVIQLFLINPADKPATTRHAWKHNLLCYYGVRRSSPVFVSLTSFLSLQIFGMVFAMILYCQIGRKGEATTTNAWTRMWPRPVSARRRPISSAQICTM